MGAEQPVAFQPEGVLHVARRMIGRDVQRVEVMFVRFHFGAVENGEAEGDEEIFNFRLDLGERMERAAGGVRSGCGEIDPFALQTGG